MAELKVILLVSGKRKSGKDYISEKLNVSLGSEKCGILRISEPIKAHYAKVNNLNLEDLMSDQPYKEEYRRDMIIWSDGIRRKDPGYFCKAACENAKVRPIWIISDIRRKTDISWFKQKYGDKIKTVRINASDRIRSERGWTFTQGVDDVASECDLDDFTEWDLIIHNNDANSFGEGLCQLMTVINI